MPELDERDKAIIEDLKWAREHATKLYQQFESGIWLAIVNKQVVASGPSLGRVKREAAKKTRLPEDWIAVTFLDGGAIYGAD